MPSIVIASDSNEEERCDILRRAGFRLALAGALDGTPENLRLIAATGGKADCLVLIATRETNPFQIAKRIRDISEAISFRGLVRVRAVPIVVQLVRQFYDYQEVDHVLVPPPLGAMNGAEYLPDLVATAIQRWRQRLLEELDYVGFAVSVDQAGKLAINHALRRRRKDTEILTDEATPGAIRKSQFLLLAEDLLQGFQPYAELQFLLNHYRDIAKNDGIQPEGVFQRFFDKNPDLLNRDAFDRHWSQPQLRLPEDPQKSYRPDFVFRPRGLAHIGAQWKVMDLKLPDERVVVSPAFHAAISSKLHRALQQLHDYRGYFNRPESAKELRERFGFAPANPKLAVLIGRRSSDEQDRLSPALDRFLDIEVLTYDDVLSMEAARLMGELTLADLF